MINFRQVVLGNRFKFGMLLQQVVSYHVIGCQLFDYFYIRNSLGRFMVRSTTHFHVMKIHFNVTKSDKCVKDLNIEMKAEKLKLSLNISSTLCSQFVIRHRL